MMNSVFGKAKKADVMRLAAIAVMIVVVLSMLPLYALARYDIPSADDYQFEPSEIREVVKSNGFVAGLKKILETVKYYYLNWQGTYSVYFTTNFLLMIGFDMPHMYYLVPIISLTFFTFSIFSICWAVFHRLLNMPKEETLIVSALLQFICLQCTPSIVEGFYWYAGSMMYTGYFSIWLISLSWIISLLIMEKPKYVPLKTSAIVIVSFLVAGSNFPTALVSSIIYILIFVAIMFVNRRKAVLLLLPLIASVAGLVLNVAAPGNMTRLSTEEVAVSSSVIQAVHISFLLGFQFIREWLSLPSVMMAAVTCCIAAFGLRNSRVHFRFPLAWTAISLCVYCALYAPSAYSYGWIGPPRYMNVCYWGWIIVLFSNSVYYGGWLAHQCKMAIQRDEQIKVLFVVIRSKLSKCICFGYILIALALFVDSSPSYYTYEGASLQRQYAALQAKKYIESGFGEIYLSYYQSRLKALEDPKQTDLVFEAFPTWCRSELLYFSDITSDENSWENQFLAEYYGKSSVKLASE